MRSKATRARDLQFTRANRAEVVAAARLSDADTQIAICELIIVRPLVAAPRMASDLHSPFAGVALDAGVSASRPNIAAHRCVAALCACACALAAVSVAST